MALDTAFMRKDLKFTVRFVEAEELTPEAIGQVEVQAAVNADDLSNNRQTEDIKRALTVLESVENSTNFMHQRLIYHLCVRRASSKPSTNLLWIPKGWILWTRKRKCNLLRLPLPLSFQTLGKN